MRRLGESRGGPRRPRAAIQRAGDSCRAGAGAPGGRRALARVGRPGRPGDVRVRGHLGVVGPPGRGVASRPRRPARRDRHRHGIGQVAGVPGTCPDRARRGPQRQRAEGQPAADGPLSRADQGAGRRSAAPPVRCTGVRPARHGRRRQLARGTRLGPRPRQLPADQPRHAAPLDPAGACPVERGCWAASAMSSSTSAITTAACSARTSPTSCGACGGSARTTAPIPRSSCRRRPWPNPTCSPDASRGSRSYRSRMTRRRMRPRRSRSGSRRSYRGATRSAAMRPRASYAARPTPRPASCSPTW